MILEPTSPQQLQLQLPPEKRKQLKIEDYTAYSEQKKQWREFDKNLRQLANEDVQTIGWIVRQYYRWGPNNQEFARLSDIELKLEYYRIRAWQRLEANKELPDTEPLEGETEAFSDIVELMDIVPDDDFWESLDTVKLPGTPTSTKKRRIFDASDDDW